MQAFGLDNVPKCIKIKPAIVKIQSDFLAL